MKDSNSDIEIRLLEALDVERIAAAFQAINWNKPVSQYQRYLREQEEDRRIILLAFCAAEFAG